jgi:Transposase DDE domain group 1
MDGILGTHRRLCRPVSVAPRIRCATDTALRSPPLLGFTQNQIWCKLVALACDLIAWIQMLALTGTGRRWEPRRLRLQLFAAAATGSASRPDDPALRHHHRRPRPARQPRTSLSSPASDTRQPSLRRPWKQDPATVSGHQPKITRDRGSQAVGGGQSRT